MKVVTLNSFCPFKIAVSTYLAFLMPTKHSYSSTVDSSILIWLFHANSLEGSVLQEMFVRLICVLHKILCICIYTHLLKHLSDMNLSDRTCPFCHTVQVLSCNLKSQT